jgi:pyrimidine operon attenuation protein/uracil phosphoribosyltransferase
MPQVMSADDLGRVIRRIAHEILESHKGADGLILVGIRTRGVHLAARLGDAISTFEGVMVPLGELDIVSYRDDIAGSTRPSAPSVIPVDINGLDVVIVDDVLYTGRTVRAALDALSDIGRARSTELAVMVDRGHRELPIRADYVGKNLPTSRGERVHVRLREVDPEDGVWVERVAA